MNALVVKICGVTHAEHVHAAAEGGASLVGLVLWPGSVRALTLDQARGLAVVARERGLASVALVVDRDPALDAELVDFDRVQFHGGEPCIRLAGSPRPTIRGIAFSPEALATWDACPHATWLLVDGPHGGGGAPFDHAALRPHRARITKPWLVAGGLTPENVASVVADLAPFGVDVSSGVERARGVKDPERIRRFCAAALGA